MPEMDGLEAAREIRDQWPEIGVIMLTAYDDRQFVVEAVRSGARGYVLKARDAEHLIQTVRLVAGGNMVIDPQLVVALAEELSTAKERDRKAETLTAREIEVLQLLAFGHTNRDIAERLYISPDTVKTHLEHIFEKLGASDRTAAVAEALRRRLIEYARSTGAGASRSDGLVRPVHNDPRSGDGVGCSEQASWTPHERRPPSARAHRLGTGLFLGVAAAAAVATYLAFPSGSREQGLRPRSWSPAPACSRAASSCARSGRGAHGGARCYLAYALFMVGAVNVRASC